jgi:hypothetical protein
LELCLDISRQIARSEVLGQNTEGPGVFPVGYGSELPSFSQPEISFQTLMVPEDF